MRSAGFGVLPLIKQFPARISVTWFIIVLENALLALIPLFVGKAIDGLLSSSHDATISLAAILAGLIIIAVVRRFYDTRVYSSIRVALGLEVSQMHKEEDVSVANAHISMARELVDFLEEQLPELLTAVIQLVVSLLVLFSFSPQLALNAVYLLVAMTVLYGLFHQRFVRANTVLNDQNEQQVRLLVAGNKTRLLQHFKALRSAEVRLSDMDAVLYGLIFLIISIFLLANLWCAAENAITSAGQIFSVVSYSWEFSEAAIALPLALQQLARLNEISTRLNRFMSGSVSDV